MLTGSQPMKNYYKEKFLRQFYALNYSTPPPNIEKSDEILKKKEVV